VISLTIGRNDEILASQELTTPSVYLDHWALRRASDTPSLAESLATSLERLSGTLVISFADIAEFPRLDAATTRRAEELIDRVRPHLFFQEFNPWSVIPREEALMAGGRPEPPHADLQLLRLVATALTPPGLEPFTCLGMLSAVTGADATATERMKATFLSRMADLRTEYLSDGDFRSAVDGAIRKQEQPRSTAIVLRELVGGLMRDSKSPLTGNDAMDFFHAVVPVSYCDFVLLDSRWRDQVDRLRARLAKFGSPLRVATAYSGPRAFDALLSALR
jgi:hypothetical protein